MIYSQKIIKIEIKNIKSNSVKTIEDLKVSAQIEQAQGVQRGRGTVQIWGIDDDDAYELTTRGTSPNAHVGDSITLWAGDNEKTLEIALISTISEAYADFSQMPENVFIIQCLNGQDLALTAPVPDSKKGEQDVKELLSSLCKEANYEPQFYGNWQLKVENPVLTGSALERIQKLCEQFDLKYSIENAVIVFSQKDGDIADSLNTLEIAADSAQCTLLSSPKHSGILLECEILFNPQIRLGQKASIKTALKSAVGDWIVKKVIHELQTITPSGVFKTRLTLDRYLVDSQLTQAQQVINGFV
jgi:hypothetical protein